MVIWIELLKAGATLAAAGVAAFVAHRIGSSQRAVAQQQANTAYAQSKVAEAKLNLDLFEQRYAIFEELWKFLSTQSRATRAN